MQPTLHQYLKESTLPKHQQAESHPFQGHLANGKLPFQSYKQYVEQLFALHEGFETNLLRYAEQPELAAIVQEDYFQLPFLKQDLDALGIAPDSVKPLECVRKFNENQLWAQHPASLLGVLYVLLGSKHGAKYIAHNVKDAYKLNDTGSLYFNPYGETFRTLWQAFTGGLNELQVSDEQRKAILEGADMTFDLFGEIGAAIWDQQPQPDKAAR